MGRKVVYNSLKNEAIVYKVSDLRSSDWYTYGLKLYCGGKVMGKKMKILVVEDFTDMRKLILAFLKEEGYKNLVEAEDGVSALRTIKSQKIDFIISDWNMPKMTGHELLKAVRVDAKISATPFLMLTANAIEDSVITACKAGVSDYLVKPFTAKVLCEKIAKITETILARKEME